MRKSLWSFLIATLFCTNTFGQEALFIPNEGQWNREFTHKMPLKYGALFFKENSIQVVLKDAAQIEDLHGHDMHQAGLSHHESTINFHVVEMEFIGASKNLPNGFQPTEFKHNYFLGDNPDKWRSGIQPYRSLKYSNLYLDAELKFHTYKGQLKYDWHLSNPEVIDRIKWTYRGASSIQIDGEGNLVINTSVGHFYESSPVSWGWKNGERVDFGSWYKLTNGQISFGVESLAYTLDSLVIDPQLIFTSFSGSLTDNWGFTATYDDQGRLYGGGVAFATGYVSTIGAYQTGFNSTSGPIQPFAPDITVSVFNPNGNTLLYATYLGGTKSDHPHSMVVNSNGELIIMGTTGSINFPTLNAIQTSNAGGSTVNVNNYDFEDSDIFITRFNASGSALLSSTYLGGSGNDGINMGIIRNYGDASRGEVVVDENDNIYITASTTSTNFPSTNCSSCSKAGGQDAVVCKLNSSGTALLWSNYYGSTSDDAGYSIKVKDNNVYVCGGTKGGNLPLTTGAYKSTKQGTSEDGFIARFNGSTGALIKSTYVGTSNYDQTFIMDIDKFGNVFVFGQTFGNYPITAGAWGTPQYRKQFLHKVSADLTTSLASTAFGSPQGTVNLVPTAFNVDDCLNILLSGWGGSTNSGYAPTSVDQLPISDSALQSTSNGSDFYFMVLGKNFTSFEYGSYFGGPSSAEHVDGGTSRFDDRGRIYQAVCAGCGGNNDLPTTPGAFSQTNNSSNCNLGVIKLDFETGTVANWSTFTGYSSVAGTTVPDTSCYALTLQFDGSTSENTNAYFWDFGQGSTSDLATPLVTFDTLGTYNVMFVAFDTVCDRGDTIYFEIEHDTANFPTSNWTPVYVSCDLFKEVEFIETLGDADFYEFDFGDGNSLVTTDQNVLHSYPSTGTFITTVTARDSFCDETTQSVYLIEFDNDANVPTVDVFADSCRYGGVDVVYTNVDSTMIFEWDFSGTPDSGMIPTFRYPESGLESVTLTISDTTCNRDYNFDFLTDIVRIEGRLFIPSAFTPNGDNKNETFKIFGNSCLEDPVFIIYDSWGNEVFKSEDPFNIFWDGTINGKPVPQDVYTYRFTGGEEVRMGTFTVTR